MTCAWASTAPGGTAKRIGPRGWGSGGGQGGGAATASGASGIGVKHLPARLRQGEGRGKEQAVGDDRKDRDGVGERRAGREVADERREQRPDAPAEVVAEALAGASQPRRKELGQERAHAREIARGEEA